MEKLTWKAGIDTLTYYMHACGIKNSDSPLMTAQRLPTRIRKKETSG
ncbi:hypothetical protein QCD58_004611 [Enterobacter hormaechei]|nr:hypothetical protein [Enterobacter hormaechei]